MSNLKDSFKQISIIKILIIFILAIFLIVVLDDIFGTDLPLEIVNIVLVIYIVYKLRNCSYCFKRDISNVFKDFPFNLVILIVVLNIFFSYGMIYLSDLLLVLVPGLSSVVFSVNAASNSIVFVGSLISSIIIAPVSEELVFRGVFFNKISERFSVHIAILASSILFGICHDFGGMFSAFVFGICMCILYIKTSNIFVPMIAHGINNLLSELIALFDVDNLIFTDPLIIVCILIFAIVSAFILFSSIRKEWKFLY